VVNLLADYLVDVALTFVIQERQRAAAPAFETGMTNR
jgi:hypothetical protein